jgi:hypothetical protein
LTSTECGYGPDRISGLRLGADCIDVFEYSSRSTGIDNTLFHGDKFVGGATEFLLGKSEAAECSGVVVKKGAVLGDFGSYARVA